MKLIVGLGNPGKEYDKTRHNAGFMTIDKIACKLNVELDKSKCKAIYGVCKYKDEKVIIAKPQTYMNLSGEAVVSLMHFYSIDINDLLVIHDDLDLPVGKIRLRTSGSSGGQKGMGNIIDLLHTQDSKRIRVGIANNKQIDTKDYVLGKVSKEDYPVYEASINKACDALLYYLDEKDYQKVMNKFN